MPNRKLDESINVLWKRTQAEKYCLIMSSTDFDKQEIVRQKKSPMTFVIFDLRNCDGIYFPWQCGISKIMIRYYFKFDAQNPSDAYRVVTSVGETMHMDTEDIRGILLQKLF